MPSNPYACSNFSNILCCNIYWQIVHPMSEHIIIMDEGTLLAKITWGTYITDGSWDSSVMFHLKNVATTEALWSMHTLAPDTAPNSLCSGLSPMNLYVWSTQWCWPIGIDGQCYFARLVLLPTLAPDSFCSGDLRTSAGYMCDIHHSAMVLTYGDGQCYLCSCLLDILYCCIL